MEEKKRGNTDKGGSFSLLKIQSLSANSLACIPNKLFHIRAPVDYYRLQQNIPLSTCRIKPVNINLISHDHSDITKDITRIRKVVIIFNKQYR